MLVMNRRMLDSIWSALVSAATSTSNSALRRIYIMKGEPPVGDGLTFNPVDNPDVLASVYIQSIQLINGVLRISSPPIAYPALETGKATWFALTGTSSNAYTIMGSVTDQADGSGLLILQSTDLFKDQPVQVLEFGLRSI